MIFLFLASICIKRPLINEKPQFNIGELWNDTSGVFIQGHGGIIKYLDDYNCFNNATKGCYVWYGEDKADGTTGIHCYASTNLYVWEDKGISLFIHNVMPEKLNGAKNDIVHDIDNLRELKRRANLPQGRKYSSISDQDIEIARNFLRAYATEIDESGKFVKYDEEHLLVGFTNLYRTYCIIERPKMIYNKQHNNFVLIFHSDGPTDSAILEWINQGMPPSFPSSCYARAKMGFAISDSPFGPFKLVNVQRMHWVEGYYDSSKGMARDMTVYVEKEGDKDIAYAIYSSEENQYIYVSKLDDTFTTWAIPQSEAKDGIDFKSRLLGNTKNREAPAIFKYNGYYYLMTSGTTGWAPNAATYHRSTALYGPYEAMGNPCEGDGSGTTFDSQSTYFIRYNEEKGQFIYLGDRWNDKDLAHSRYVLLPVEIDTTNNEIKLHKRDHWSLDDVFQ